MNLKKNLTSKSKRKTFPRAWNTASWSVKSNFLKRRWKITSLSFWFAQDFRDWTVLVMYIPITLINSICSTFDFASTACSFVIVTYTVVGHITIYETWKVEVNNLRFSDSDVLEFCMSKNHFVNLGLPALTVRSDLYAVCTLRVYIPRDYNIISQK